MYDICERFCPLYDTLRGSCMGQAGHVLHIHKRRSDIDATMLITEMFIALTLYAMGISIGAILGV